MPKEPSDSSCAADRLQGGLVCLGRYGVDEFLGQSRSIFALKGDLLALEATTASSAATSVAETSASTATSTAAPVTEATSATATTSAAAETTAATTASAEATVIGAASGVVQTNTATRQVSTLQLLNNRLGILDGVEGDVTEALEASSFPVP